MMRGGATWLMRAAVGLAAVVVLAITSRTTIVRGWGSWMFGWLERPFLVSEITLEERGEVVFASRGELAEALGKREEQLVSIAQQAAEWEGAVRELEEARRLLDYKETHSETLVAARVLGHSAPEFPYSIVIDKGAVDGVARFQPVVANEGVLLGTVEEVFAHTARVQLLAHPQTRIGGKALGAHATLGVVEGLSEPLLGMAYVPQDAPIKLHTVIVTSGADPLIPSNLIVGLVRQVEKDPNTPFLHVLIEPVVDAQTARFVGVVTGL